MELDINTVINKMGSRIAELEVEVIMLRTENEQLQEQLNGDIQDIQVGAPDETNTEA